MINGKILFIKCHWEWTRRSNNHRTPVIIKPLMPDINILISRILGEVRYAYLGLWYREQVIPALNNCTRLIGIH